MVEEIRYEKSCKSKKHKIGLQKGVKTSGFKNKAKTKGDGE